jgi:RHS repeat-associated protein
MEGPWHVPVEPEDRVNRYQYNGKELNDDIGLGWSDYGARWYDGAIGRFTGVDALADQFVHLSTYNYAGNSPISNIDLWGLQPVFFATNPVIMAGNSGTWVRPITTFAASSSKPVTSNIRWHHIIPKAFKSNRLIQAARRGGFKYDGKENKMPLEQFFKASGKGRHATHPKYNAELQRRLVDFMNKNKNFTNEEAARFVRNLVQDLSKTINNNPGTKINDLFEQGLPVIDFDNTSSPIDNTRTEIIIPVQGENGNLESCADCMFMKNKLNSTENILPFQKLEKKQDKIIIPQKNN